MSDEAPVEVITEAVADEARRWHKLADHMAPLQGSVKDLHLSENAFFIGTLSVVDAAIHAKSYGDFLSLMTKAAGGAPTEFDQLGTALKKIADQYERTDEIGYVKLSAIFGPQKEVPPAEGGD
ncbi:MAG: hypothetical protein ACRDTU_01035 [Micromonosporaceae bacterium]